ncbi:hypothetical protein J2R99_002500 [Rhodopseudomonas julia]|uniref:Transposase n=1 Tax=Rhodopseudomonas julia TaxID=200617 RepID=A0ABU0C9R5_9BRAD|nr:hypothetical protein [Rhodopseudomonas julia]
MLRGMIPPRSRRRVERRRYHTAPSTIAQIKTKADIKAIMLIDFARFMASSRIFYA